LLGSKLTITRKRALECSDQITAIK